MKNPRRGEVWLVDLGNVAQSLTYLMVVFLLGPLVLRSLKHCERAPSDTPPAFVGRVLVALGDNDAALDELERAAEERPRPVLSLAADPDFDPLQENERFTALVDEIGVR